MPGKQYFYFLIICEIWSQGIIRVFANENIPESSSVLARQKRVVSHVPGEDIPVRIDDHPYIVNVKLNNRIFCVGSILSRTVITTAAKCAQFDRSEYTIASSSSRSNRVNVAHNVTDIKRNVGNHPDRAAEGIALLTIHPRLAYSRFCNKLNIHVGPVLPNMHGIVTGWGYNFRNGIEYHGTEAPTQLRSITVPIMAHRDCVNRYRQVYPITDMDICTFDPQRRTGHTDTGAPLIIDNFLVGIFLRRGPPGVANNTEYPDVFAFVQHVNYRRWILENI